MAYEFNNDDHFDMKSQMMVGKIGENLFLKIYGNSPQCEIDDLRDDAVFQDKDVDFRVRQLKKKKKTVKGILFLPLNSRLGLLKLRLTSMIRGTFMLRRKS